MGDLHEARDPALDHHVPAKVVRRPLRAPDGDDLLAHRVRGFYHEGRLLTQTLAGWSCADRPRLPPRRRAHLDAVDGGALAHVGLAARVQHVHVRAARLAPRPATLVRERHAARDDSEIAEREARASRSRSRARRGRRRRARARRRRPGAARRSPGRSAGRSSGRWRSVSLSSQADAGESSRSRPPAGRGSASGSGIRGWPSASARPTRSRPGRSASGTRSPANCTIGSRRRHRPTGRSAAKSSTPTRRSSDELRR